MQITKPSAELLSITENAEQLIELAGRTAYKSEDKITKDSAGKFIRMIMNRNHMSVLEHASATFRFICDRGCCYDKETKVLTKNGWKYFFNLTESDEYYTLDDNNNILFTEANKIICKKYTGKLDVRESTQINLHVTPNHNLWVFDYNKRKTSGNRVWKFIQSSEATNCRYKFLKGGFNNIFEEICDHITIPSITIPSITIPRGFCPDKTYPPLNLDYITFMELLGWWITDGSIYDGKNGSGNRISITQIKHKGRERIIYLLGKLNLPYTIYDKEIRIKCPQLFSWLKYNFIKTNDNRKSYYIKLPRWIFKLSPKYINKLLDGIIGGDGSKTSGNGFQIYTASQDFAEDIVELALLVGKCANIRTQPKRTRIFPNGHTSYCKQQYVIQLHNRIEHLFNSNKPGNKTTRFYDDYVYCVELPKYHKLYVMRNGKACWCGNSHELVRHRIASFTQESTRYVGYNKDKFGGQISVIEPPMKSEKARELWKKSMKDSEQAYMSMIESGESPQIARSVLPNSLKTEIVMTCNFREWLHVFDLRTSPAAHPQIREIMFMAQKILIEKYPNIFKPKE